jgi:glycerol-3-phosphate acyltransferase PlsY
MDNPIFYYLGFLFAYFLGSIPTSVWVGKWFYNIDIREHGSGNAGATNTFRILGKKAGIPVLIIDILKGVFAVSLSYWFSGYDQTDNNFINYQLGLGFCALMGHIFPLFANFRGGKGVATILGAVIAINPIGAFIAMGVFIIVLLISNYVSLSSMIAALSFPVYVFVFSNTSSISLKIFSMVIAILIIIMHHNNIKRLIKGEESKVFKRRKS